MDKVVLGIDVAKLKLDVALMLKPDKILIKEFENSGKGFKLLQGWLKSLHVTALHVCLEATGTYHEAIAEFLHEEGYFVCVVNPIRTQGDGQSQMKRNKTDPADARSIARFCLTQDLERWMPPSPEIKHLQDLTRRIEVLREMLQSEKNRLGTAPENVKASVKRIILAFEEEIKELESLVRAHIDKHPDLKAQSELLQTIPGIGEKTAQILLSELDFSRFESARKLAAQAGVTPRREKSGTSLDRTRLSKLGNSRVRKALYFPAIVASRHNEVIKGFAERLSQRGKRPMQIVCASMRKLLHLAFGVLKSKLPFDPKVAIRA